LLRRADPPSSILIGPLVLPEIVVGEVSCELPHITKLPANHTRIPYSELLEKVLPSAKITEALLSTFSPLLLLLLTVLFLRIAWLESCTDIPMYALWMVLDLMVAELPRFLHSQVQRSKFLLKH